MAGGFAELLLNNRSQGIKDLLGSYPLLSTLRYVVGRVSACASMCEQSMGVCLSKKYKNKHVTLEKSFTV